MSATQFTQKFMENLVAKNPAEPEFHQRVREVVESLVPVLDAIPNTSSTRSSNAPPSPTASTLSASPGKTIRA
jgi:hypothetical protein